MYNQCIFNVLKLKLHTKALSQYYEKNQHQKMPKTYPPPKIPNQINKPEKSTNQTRKTQQTKEPKRNGKCPLIDVLRELSPLSYRAVVQTGFCPEHLLRMIFFLLICCLIRVPFLPGHSKNTMHSSLGSTGKLLLYWFWAHYLLGEKKGGDV